MNEPLIFYEKIIQPGRGPAIISMAKAATAGPILPLVRMTISASLTRISLDEYRRPVCRGGFAIPGRRFPGAEIRAKNRHANIQE
ncbi:MAG TPA: hypothetical protein VFW28_10695 [Micropepsaceae bacterium]|nr:hypothetical protein [Micropepsaceae bacterium]